MFDWIADKWEKLPTSIVDLVDALIGAIVQLLSTLMVWVSELILALLGWILGILGWWVKPFLEWLTVLLPDPTGMGFRYVFETYHFISAWFDFDALFYVVVLLVQLHLLTLTIRAMLWAAQLIRLIKGILFV